MLDKISTNFAYLNPVDTTFETTNSTSVRNNTVNNGLKHDSFERNPFENKSFKVQEVQTPVQYYGLSPKILLRVFLDTDFINNLVEKNPEVKNILQEHNVEYELHPENVKSIINSHLSTTTAYALKIANKLNLSVADKKVLEMASTFHDFGKIFIPDEILNKMGRLTAEEKEIMKLHAELGYQVLLPSGINKRVLNLIRDHHSTQNSDELLTQILSVADIYSALKEERCYKKPMSDAEAFKILDQKAQKGEVSAEVVNALKSAIYKEECVA